MTATEQESAVESAPRFTNLDSELAYWATELKVDGILCFRSAREWPIAPNEQALFSLYGYYWQPDSVDRPSVDYAAAVKYSVPGQGLEDWLLDDRFCFHPPVGEMDQFASAYEEYAKRVDRREWGRCSFLHRLFQPGPGLRGVERYIKIIRGSLAAPWLVVVFLNPPLADKSETRVHFQTASLSLAKRVLGERRHASREQTRLEQTIAECARTLEPLARGLEEEYRSGLYEFLRHLLVRILWVLRGDRSDLKILATAHLFLRTEKAEHLRRFLWPKPNESHDGQQHEPLRLASYIVEVPLAGPRDPPAILNNLKRLADSQLASLLQIHECGNEVPLGDVAPLRLLDSRAIFPEEQHLGVSPVFARAAVSGQTYFIDDDNRKTLLPEDGDIRLQFLGGQARAQLVIPLVDDKMQFSVGVLNIELSEEHAIRRDQIIAAQRLASTVATAVRNARNQRTDAETRSMAEKLFEKGVHLSNLKSTAAEFCEHLMHLSSATAVSMLNLTRNEGRRNFECNVFCKTGESPHISEFQELALLCLRTSWIIAFDEETAPDEIHIVGAPQGERITPLKTKLQRVALTANTQEVYERSKSVVREYCATRQSHHSDSSRRSTAAVLLVPIFLMKQKKSDRY